MSHRGVIVHRRPPEGTKTGDECQIVYSKSTKINPITKERYSSGGPPIFVRFVKDEVIDGPDDGALNKGDYHYATVQSGDIKHSQFVSIRDDVAFYFVHKPVLPVNAAGQGVQSVTTSSVSSSPPPGNSTRIELLFLKGSCISTPITHEFAETETVADIKTFIRNKPECDVPKDSKIILVWVDNPQKLNNDKQSISTLGEKAQITVSFNNISSTSDGGGRKSRRRRNTKKNKRTRRKSLKKQQHRRK
jgi:hypothetical protein